MKSKLLFVLALTGTLSIAPVSLPALASQPAPAPVPEPSGSSSGDANLYADGTRAINESRWQDAVSIFDKVAQLHGEHAEGALYWKAYAENKEGQSANALGTCGELRQRYPKSRWLEECGALEIEIRGKSADPVSPQAEADENLKLLALNALMEQDQSKAVPIIQKILTSNQSEELKSRALFVLAQSQSPEAQALVGQIARGQSGPELQIRAIRIIAAAQGKRSGDMLAEIYQHSADAQVKKTVLQSYVITGDSARLLAAARQESDPELVRTAVHALGAIRASTDLLTLYRATSSVETKHDILNGLIASGHDGVGALSDIARSEQNPDLRHAAIRNLGIAGGMSVAPTLVDAYQKNSDAETKKAAAQALFLAGDAHDLVSLARAEKDMEMKKYLVQQLSLMHNQEASRYMLEILNK